MSRYAELGWRVRGDATVRHQEQAAQEAEYFGDPAAAWAHRQVARARAAQLCGEAVPAVVVPRRYR